MCLEKEANYGYVVFFWLCLPSGTTETDVISMSCPIIKSIGTGDESAMLASRSWYPPPPPRLDASL